MLWHKVRACILFSSLWSPRRATHLLIAHKRKLVQGRHVLPVASQRSLQVLLRGGQVAGAALKATQRAQRGHTARQEMGGRVGANL